MQTGTLWPTPYNEINQLLGAIVQGCKQIFADNLIGVYLFGSLTYGDFDLERSDIDITVILDTPASTPELERIKQLHLDLRQISDVWANRLECSYTPRSYLNSILPPADPRPYYGEGTFHSAAHYGNEWIINLYLLRENGIALFGSDFAALLPPIEIGEVQNASIRDLFREWEPKIADPEWLNNSHYQSYLVLNLCRILYTVICGKAGSKSISAAWVIENYPQWSELIGAAQNWHYGMEMDRQGETLAFLRFAIAEVKTTPLYVVM